MIWIIFALMVAGVLALLLVPLVRAPKLAPGRIAYDLAVYKDQLTEIDRDLDRGVLTGDQGDSARTEIQRRMLAAAEQINPEAAPDQPRFGWAAAAITGLVVTLSFSFYFWLGSPKLPDQPFGPRATEVGRMQGQMDTIRSMVARLSERLEKSPDDGPGWAMLGRSLQTLQEPGKAEDAYEKAVALLPNDIGVRLEYASLLLDQLDQSAPVPPRVVALMGEVLALDGDNPNALYFVGIAEAQAGHIAHARTLLTRVLAELPDDSPDRADIAKQIDDLNR